MLAVAARPGRLLPGWVSAGKESLSHQERAPLSAGNAG